jgi:CRP/FNR family cyclic AMP-dependent transcriptional regulator
VLLPLNATRLYQMLQLIGRVRVASQGNLDMAWLKPFMHKRSTKAGEIIFSAGDVAGDMYYTVAGRYRLKEIDGEIAPGQVIGELGLVAPQNRRTVTFECVEDGELLAIGYAQVKQLYFQNPKFGFYFLDLIAQRLFRDIQRLEAKIAARA